MTNKPFHILAAIACAILAASCAEPAGAPAILSFSFLKADNPALPADVVGTIDDELSTIELRLPASVADYSSLKPTIGVSNGAVVAPAAPADYSASPTPISVAHEGGEQRTYLVTVAEAIAPAPATALLFTEYYAGTGYGYGYSDKRNRWVELTNVSDDPVDLAQYRLVKRARVGGARVEARDVSVRLSGILAAGASLVIYNGATNTTRFPLSGAVGAPDILVSDAAYNGVLDCDGDDGFQLVRDGVVLDVLGPNGGMGADYYWGREKRMLRKRDNVPSEAWAPLQWISYGVKNNATDYANAGASTDSYDSDHVSLSFFAFEYLETPAYGIIDEEATTVTIAVPRGTDLASVVVSIGVEGMGASAQGKVLISGETALDFSSNVTIKAFADDGSTFSTYTVRVIYERAFAYTERNYAFDGGIAALKASFGTPNVSGLTAVKSFESTTISGILTGKNVSYAYKPDSANVTYSNCFFLQDSTGGILIWADDQVDYPLGTRLRVEIDKALLYYFMPVVIAYGEVSRVDADTYDIYYKEGNYANVAALGSVYRYSGAIASGMADYNEGTFSGSLMFQGVDNVAGLADRLETGDTGSFYGPALVSYGKYKMCISQLEQIQQ